jgi:hypothetical protein
METIKGTITLAAGSIGALVFMTGVTMDQYIHNQVMAAAAKEAATTALSLPALASEPINAHSDFGLSWYFLFLIFSLYGGVIFARIRGMETLSKFRIPFISLATVCVASIPEEINSALRSLASMVIASRVMSKTTPIDPQLGMEILATRLTIIGSILTIVPMFVLIVLLGADSDVWTNPTTKRTNNSKC